VSLADADKANPHTRRTVLASLGVSVVDFHCRAHVEPLGPEEPNPTHGLAFVRKGVFKRKQPGETVVADPNHVLFFNAGQPYRYAHPLPGGDACTIVVLDGGQAVELVRRYEPRDAEREETPFALGHGIVSPRAARLHYELLGLLRREAPAMASEDAVVELADAAVASAYRLRRGVSSRRVSTPTERRHRDLVEAAKLVVNERLERLPSLGELARTLGCSPFHLSRTFHRTAGLSLRAYAGRLRAQRAAYRLADGERDLTVLALELGYADHSHFTNAFRRQWGEPPSRFRLAHRTRG
jgi:AraC-like DNA-binding protein